jgi:hypothetical protein
MSRTEHVIFGLLATPVVLCAACAGPVRQPPTSVHVGSGGASAAAIFYPLDTAAILAHVPTGPETARLDGALAVRPLEPLLATNQWPQQVRPSITEQRRIHIPDRDGTFLFFLHERPWGRTGGAPWPPPW